MSVVHVFIVWSKAFHLGGYSFEVDSTLQRSPKWIPLFSPNCNNVRELVERPGT